MNEAFAEKLRWWLVSVMTLVLGTVSASAAVLLGRHCETSNIWTCIGMSSEGLALFPALFPALVAWHAFDVIQHRRAQRWLTSLLTGYPLLFGGLSLLMVLYVLVSTGHFHATSA